MPNPYFKFKKFTIYHDRCAMKVGTDGVLLGAWTNINESHKILDVGTGSGVIALMLAQRCPHAHITAMDIDTEAVKQAQGNIDASPWKDRVVAVEKDICTYTSNIKFDTIVSNPPYFVNALKCTDNQRNKARHTDTLDAERLFGKVSDLLTSEGHFSLIIPTDQVDDLISLALRKFLYLTRHTQVITRPGLSPKRSLLEFRKIEASCCTNNLLVELERHVYSEEYIALTKDFYLKM